MRVRKRTVRSLLRELLDAQRSRKSEQLSKEQLALFEALWKARDPEEEESEPTAEQGRTSQSKFADHQPLHRQEKIFQRQGVQISRKTMGGWLPPVAELLNPLYQAAKKVLFESKVIGTDDTGLKVLDRKLPFARIGRIWSYVGDCHYPVLVYDYTPTRGRDGPARFLEG